MRYSQVWEDHALLEAALAIEPGDDVLSICSAGCNTLALLLQEPRSVTAVDVSPAQTALLELKLAAVKTLSHPELAALIGVREHPDRLSLYARAREALPQRSRDVWDARGELIEAGIGGSGMLDSYFRMVRERLIEPVVGRDACVELLALGDPDEQRELFERHFSSPEFEQGFRKAAGRDALAGRARDASQFRYVTEEDVGGYFWTRFRHVCTEVPACGNFYLEWFLTGGYRDLETGPPFLRPQSFERLRELADRVTVVNGTLDGVLAEADPGAFSKANLSDMFEYLSEDATDATFELLASRIRPGGRIAYWNLLVPRRVPDDLNDRVETHADVADALWRRDRCFFYGGFCIDEVVA
ncbi:MAG: DUF3419 family protein [Thermoleophilaceae bacterium]